MLERLDELEGAEPGLANLMQVVMRPFPAAQQSKWPKEPGDLDRPRDSLGARGMPPQLFANIEIVQGGVSQKHRLDLTQGINAGDSGN